MSSSFDSLPPEVAQRCVEFLPFAEVHAEIKQVSKATRKAARRALTRGRWKPIRYVAEEGLAFCTPARPADDLRVVDGLGQSLFPPRLLRTRMSKPLSVLQYHGVWQLGNQCKLEALPCLLLHEAYHLSHGFYH